MVLKILQTNLGQTKAAHDLAYAKVCESNIDLLVVAEPNKAKVSKPGWILDTLGDIAIYTNNKKCIIAVPKKQGYLIVELRSLVLVCGYISPNISLLSFKKKVDDIMMNARNTKKDFVIMGDFNCKSQLWGSQTTDRRGEYWAEWVAELDLVVNNEGNAPTFVRGNSHSFIDYVQYQKGLKISRKMYGSGGGHPYGP